MFAKLPSQIKKLQWASLLAPLKFTVLKELALLED
jgi:hypothetical protein